MNHLNHKKRNLFRMSIIVLFITITSAFTQYHELFYTPDQWISDILNQRPGNVLPNIKIIGIDEKSQAELGPYRQWNRNIFADLIHILCNEKNASPLVIGLDITYIGNTNTLFDQQLANACKIAGNVVVASNIIFKDSNKVLDIKAIEYPYSALMECTRMGFTNSLQNKDSYIRSSITTIDFLGEGINSFAYEIYLAYIEKTSQPRLEPDTDSYNRFYFQYSEKPGNGYEVVSFSDVINGKIDKNVFKDCIVLVGAYAPGMLDAYNVPIERGKQMFGVEIHGNIVGSLLQGKTYLPVNPFLLSLVTGLVSAGYYILGVRFKLILSLILLIGIIITSIVSNVILFQFGWSISILTVMLFPTCIFLYLLIKEYLLEQIRRKKIVEAFKKYVSPQIVDEISQKKNYILTLGGEKKEIAVMFVDIRNFTSMSERLAPEQVVDILNEYLSLTTNAILNNGGTLDKFIGDAAMAIFNAPFDLDDYVFKAVKTAVDITEGSIRLNQLLEERYENSIGFGIGINCGSAIVGNVGCDFRMDYTAIGDTVNTASRLENISYQGQILITSSIYEKIKDRIDASSVGTVMLKGKSNRIAAYQVNSIKIAERGNLYEGTD